MNIVQPKAEMLYNSTNAERMIEAAGRTCYKSEEKISENTSHKFIQNILKRGHESVIEHCSSGFRIICSRACAQQITRHRLFSYSMESQRYCNYSSQKFGKQISFIKPFDLDDNQTNIWRYAMETAEKCYFRMLNNGCKSEDARSVLPNSCKTELVMTGNFRSWRNFLSLRLSPHAQAEIRFLASQIQEELEKSAPNIFGKETFNL